MPSKMRARRFSVRYGSGAHRWVTSLDLGAAKRGLTNPHPSTVTKVNLRVVLLLDSGDDIVMEVVVVEMFVMITPQLVMEMV